MCKSPLGGRRATYLSAEEAKSANPEATFLLTIWLEKAMQLTNADFFDQSDPQDSQCWNISQVGRRPCRCGAPSRLCQIPTTGSLSVRLWKTPFGFWKGASCEWIFWAYGVRSIDSRGPWRVRTPFVVRIGFWKRPRRSNAGSFHLFGVADILPLPKC